MKTILSIIFCCAIYNISAQEFLNIELYPDSTRKLSRIIYIKYDLLIRNKEHTLSEYDIEVFATYGRDNKWIKLEMLQGNKGVLPGHNRVIAWHYFSDLPEFDGKDLRVMMRGTLNWDHEEDRYDKKGKITSVLQDLAFPGWGVNRVLQRKHFWKLGILGYGLLGAGLAYRFNANQNYELYKNSESIPDGNRLFSLAQQQERTSNILLYSAGTVWAGTMIFTLMKGTQNQIRFQIIKEKNVEQKNKGKMTSLNLYVVPTGVGIIGRF
jgi:hypothetical protein